MDAALANPVILAPETGIRAIAYCAYFGRNGDGFAVEAHLEATRGQTCRKRELSLVAIHCGFARETIVPPSVDGSQFVLYEVNRNPDFCGF
ncbi:MAG: hypothetical protein MT490_05115 [Sphingomonas sp.]|uniref:hypothetical protein n=1 Tax=Sphingomonas sp. TaxID=28214 RepID=UPI002274E4B3|nr:hypothetical protein [Sphingomonas sp.]MCX8475160.1 hypothetical protein [Sphingomonas sp.]